MTLSRGRDGYRAPVMEVDEGQISPQRPDMIARPLLMAPPRGRLADARDRAAETLYPLVPSSPQVISLALFSVRVASLVWPCWPYMPRAGIGFPLIVITGVDLVRLTSRRPPATNVFVPRARETFFGGTRAMSYVLLMLHLAVVLAGTRSGTMCERPYPDRWVMDAE